jgi:hypothetical protein
MPVSARNVIARYREEPQNQGPFEHDKDWMTHLKDKSETSVSPSKVILKMMDKDKLKDVMKDTDPGVSTNPYDYADPNSAPKDQKGSAPFINEVPPEIDKGYYNRPEVFEEDKPLDYWRQVREQDWTQDEDQQSPAISLTRSPGAGRCASMSKTAATLNGIVEKDAHYNKAEKMQKASSVSVNLIGNKEKRAAGLYAFNARSSSAGQDGNASKGKIRRVYFQFLKPSEGAKHIDNLLEYPVQISCNCESFLFHGAQYYALHGRYMYKLGIPANRRNRNIAPTPREQVSSNRFTPRGENTPALERRVNMGRGINFKTCKHIIAAHNYLKSNQDLVLIEKPSTPESKPAYESFSEFGPASPEINSKIWEDLFGFEFNKENIKRRVQKKKPAIPAHFRDRSVKKKFNEWIKAIWVPRTDEEKIKVLQTLVDHPEEIFLILLKDAYFTGGATSNHLVDKSFDLMDRVIEARTPKEDIPEPSPDEIAKAKKDLSEDTESLPDKEELDQRSNLKTTPEGVDVETDDGEEENTPKTVEPATKPVEDDKDKKENNIKSVEPAIKSLEDED